MSFVKSPGVIIEDYTVDSDASSSDGDQDAGSGRSASACSSSSRGPGGHDAPTPKSRTDKCTSQIKNRSVARASNLVGEIQRASSSSALREARGAVAISDGQQIPAYDPLKSMAPIIRAARTPVSGSGAELLAQANEGFSKLQPPQETWSQILNACPREVIQIGIPAVAIIIVALIIALARDPVHLVYAGLLVGFCAMAWHWITHQETAQRIAAVTSNTAAIIKSNEEREKSADDVTSELVQRAGSIAEVQIGAVERIKKMNAELVQEQIKAVAAAQTAEYDATKYITELEQNGQVKRTEITSASEERVTAMQAESAKTVAAEHAAAKRRVKELEKEMEQARLATERDLKQMESNAVIERERLQGQERATQLRFQQEQAATRRALEDELDRKRRKAETELEQARIKANLDAKLEEVKATMEREREMTKRTKIENECSIQ